MNQSYPPISNTFHGRDLFVHAATMYSQGRRDQLIDFDPKELVYLNTSSTPTVAYIDSFGNIKTTQAIEPYYRHGMMLTVTTPKGRTFQIPFVETFGQVAISSLLCYKGSNDTLEIAVNLGSGAQTLDVSVGDALTIMSTNQ